MSNIKYHGSNNYMNPLAKYLAEFYGSQEDFAKDFGEWRGRPVYQSQVSSWRNKLGTPSFYVARDLEKFTEGRVSLKDWAVFERRLQQEE